MYISSLEVVVLPKQVARKIFLFGWIDSFRNQDECVRRRIKNQCKFNGINRIDQMYCACVSMWQLRLYGLIMAWRPVTARNILKMNLSQLGDQSKCVFLSWLWTSDLLTVRFQWKGQVSTWAFEVVCSIAVIPDLMFCKCQGQGHVLLTLLGFQKPFSCNIHFV